jgi:hypothetical protein
MMDDSRLERLVADALHARGSGASVTATPENLSQLRERLDDARRRRHLAVGTAAAAAVLAVVGSTVVVRAGLDDLGAPPGGPATSPSAPATSATAPPDQFVAVDGRGRIVLADPYTGAIRQTLTGSRPGLPPQDPVIDADGRHVYVIAADGRRILRIGVDDGSETVLAAPGERVDALAISGDGNVLAFLAGPTVHVMTLDDQTAREIPGFGASAVHADGLALSPDGSRLAVGVSDRRGIFVWLLDLATADSFDDAEAVASPAGVLQHPMWTDAGLFGVSTSGTSSDDMLNELVAIDPDSARVTHAVTELTDRLHGITMRREGEGALVLVDGETGMARFSTAQPSAVGPLPGGDDLNQPAF